MNSPGHQTAAVIPLRDARRNFTRERICEAANDVFFTRGYEATTVEQIAEAAGTQRSTLYTHFRDKEEILGAIAASYTLTVRDIHLRLAGPDPTDEEIAAWIGQLAAFVARRRTPTELLVFMGHLADVPEAVGKFGDDVFRMLAARLPAFARALEPGEDKAFAWATTVMRELGWALCYNARHNSDGRSRAKLDVAANLFARFVRGQI